MKNMERRRNVLSTPAHSNNKKVFRTWEKMLEVSSLKECGHVIQNVPFVCLFFPPPSIGYRSWKCCSLPYQHAHIYKNFCISLRQKCLQCSNISIYVSQYVCSRKGNIPHKWHLWLWVLKVNLLSNSRHDKGCYCFQIQ